MSGILPVTKAQDECCRLGPDASMVRSTTVGDHCHSTGDWCRVHAILPHATCHPILGHQQIDSPRVLVRIASSKAEQHRRQDRYPRCYYHHDRTIHKHTVCTSVAQLRGKGTGIDDATNAGPLTPNLLWTGASVESLPARCNKLSKKQASEARPLRLPSFALHVLPSSHRSPSREGQREESCGEAHTTEADTTRLCP